MIDVRYWPTPNGWKISIMLEECGLPYKLVPVNIGAGDQFKPEFPAISPNNRMPAIVDSDTPGGDAPVAVFESGVILQYLAGKTGKFLPKDLRPLVRDIAVGQLADGRPWANGRSGEPLQHVCTAVQSAGATRVRPGALQQRGQSPVRGVEQTASVVR